MTSIEDIIQSAVKRAPGGSGISYAGKTIGNVPMPRSMRSKSLTLTPKGSNVNLLIQSAIRRAPSIQPSVPKIATSSVTQRSLSAPVAPTAIGRLGSVARTDPLQSSYMQTLLPPGSRTGQIIQSSVRRSSASGGFTPIPSASAAPLGGGAVAAAPSSGALGGITGSLTGLGSSITSTVKSYIPIATKIVLAIIAIKMLLWLMRGRR